MKIEMIGINHESFDLEIREKASIDQDSIAAAEKEIISLPGVEGAAIISTCNRVEIYISPQKHFVNSDLRKIFAEATGLDLEEFKDAYIYRDDDAVRHLFYIASGLNSKLLGEVQILTQVKQAYYAALERGSLTGFLNRFFLKAIECGKFVRDRTAISKGAVSVGSASVDLANKIFGNLENLNVLIIGAGDTGKTAALNFKSAGVVNWKISNRTGSKAEELAQKLSAEKIGFPPSLEDVLWADIVVTAVGNQGVLFSFDDFVQKLETRVNPICFLDLAVPRNIDPKLKELDSAFVYSVDDFEELVASNLNNRKMEATRADKLVSQKVASFVKWHRENRVAPTIEQLKDILEGIRQSEMEKNWNKFCEKDRLTAEQLSKSLVKKIINQIIINMKKASLDKDDLSLAKSILMAFAKEDESIAKTLEHLDHELSH